jgi:hypothetical protein
MMRRRRKLRDAAVFVIGSDIGCDGGWVKNAAVRFNPAASALFRRMGGICHAEQPG